LPNCFVACDFTWAGSFNLGSQGGADGMAFVFQNTGVNVAAQHGLTGTPQYKPLFYPRI